MKLLITGGAGFIGSAVIRHLIRDSDDQVVNVDKLTYAGNLDSLEECLDHPRHTFVRADIGDGAAMARVFDEFQPDAVMHLAAESHVDRSIDGPAPFIHTNLVGTFVLLEAARHYWSQLDATRQRDFRFHHVSTDEVYGDLENPEELFTERTPYAPSSPYSASKAGSDHLARAWHRTYGLPVVISNCSNNYGPCQFPEKLIPLMILNALEGASLPVYGRGDQVRDWLHVEDHARALRLVLTQGGIGETYNIGGHNEMRNLAVVETICDLLDELAPRPDGSHRRLIRHVEDRPGHDRRYAIDASKIQRELGWTPRHSFTSGIRHTVDWYLANRRWWQRVRDGSYRGERLGLAR